MGDRLPVELRCGLIPQVLAWFIRCAGESEVSLDPHHEHLVTFSPYFADAIRMAANRTPYEPIGDYMSRWWFMPEIFGERARIHCTKRSDHDRDLHDHPWHFVSLILAGGYTEFIEVPGSGGMVDSRRYRPGDMLFRHAAHRHRLEVSDGQECWSIVFTSPNVREWGFWTEAGFVPWQQYPLLQTP
jgi:hypothetical protein